MQYICSKESDVIKLLLASIEQSSDTRHKDFPGNYEFHIQDDNFAVTQTNILKKEMRQARFDKWSIHTNVMKIVNQITVDCIQIIQRQYSLKKKHNQYL